MSCLSFGLACGGGDSAGTSEDESAYGGETADDSTTGSDLTSAHAVTGFKALEAPVSRVLSQDLTALLPAGASVPARSTLTATRSLALEGTPAYLVVAEPSMRSLVVKKSDFDAAAAAGSSVFTATLKEHVQAPLNRVLVADAAQEMAVSIDMCQSSKVWDLALFDWLRQVGRAIGAPVPVAIAMTGGWAKAHGPQLLQLIGWHAAKELDIVWVNHSYTHPLNCNAAKTSCAFLTAPSVDFLAEVTENEKLLLGQGAVPSALFRFPGLVHDSARRSQLSGLSLFALDADTWLAKGQPTHDGSLILVHGNGNEPPGISKFFSLAEQGHWLDQAKAGKLRFVSPLRTISAAAQ